MKIAKLISESLVLTYNSVTVEKDRKYHFRCVLCRFHKLIKKATQRNVFTLIEERNIYCHCSGFNPNNPSRARQTERYPLNPKPLAIRPSYFKKTFKSF